MPTNRLKVLCVDDNPDIADSEVLLLEACGFDARACYDGPAALVEARAFLPDAYLVDLNMPGMDGCAVTRQLRAERDGPPPVIVAVTAKSGREDYRRTADAGFDHHLVKPVDPQRLIGMLSGLRRASG